MTKNKIDLGIKVAIGALLVVLAFIVVRTMNDHVVGPGDSAPDFTITTDHGARLSTASFAGKVLVLHFWASWCGPCVEEMPALNEFTRKVAGNGVVVLGISGDRNPAAYHRFLNANHLEFDTALDLDEDISSSYGTFKFPETYVIDRNGKVYEKFPVYDNGDESRPYHWIDGNVKIYERLGEYSDDLVKRLKSL
jgi:cytochrome c biogenesis protein CcmG/thiol:disulfide interchange protein DsbE